MFRFYTSADSKMEIEYFQRNVFKKKCYFDEFNTHACENLMGNYRLSTNFLLLQY